MGYSRKLVKRYTYGTKYYILILYIRVHYIHFLYGRQLTYPASRIENMDAGIISDSLMGLLGRIFFGAHTTVVCRCKTTSSVELG